MKLSPLSPQKSQITVVDFSFEEPKLFTSKTNEVLHVLKDSQKTFHFFMSYHCWLPQALLTFQEPLFSRCKETFEM